LLAFEMISAQFPEPFGTAVNTAKVCFHFYMVSLVAISYYTHIYSIETPKGNKFDPPKGRSWQFSSKRYFELVNDNRIWFGANGNNVPRIKKFLTEVQEGVIPRTLWLYSEVGSNDDAKRMLKEIFDNNPFDSPKPVTLIQRIIQLTCDKNDIILDSFAGSGTTAHAVLDWNKEDGGNRKFILIECEEYADKITAERVRRVIKGYKKSLRAEGVAIQSQSQIASSQVPRNDKTNGLGGSFSYFELGDPIEMENILEGNKLPSYKEMVRYVFYTATGKEFDENKIDEKSNYIGENAQYQVYLFYKPDLEYLKNTALTLDRAEQLGIAKEKRRLVFAPTKYLNQEQLEQLKIDFAQLPYEIYRMEK